MASPEATTRMAWTRSSAAAYLSRKPLAPAATPFEARASRPRGKTADQQVRIKYWHPTESRCWNEREQLAHTPAAAVETVVAADRLGRAYALTGRFDEALAFFNRQPD
jgi:hypothetical protein